MTNADYKATPEQWAFLRDCAANGPTPVRDQSAAQNSCLLELRARVEALEPTVKESLTVPPAGSLVELLQRSVWPHKFDDACEAICGVATWLRKNGHASAAAALEQEADRG